MQGKFEEMKGRILNMVESRKVPEETGRRHKGFNEWETKKVCPWDHQSIVEVSWLTLIGWCHLFLHPDYDRMGISI